MVSKSIVSPEDQSVTNVELFFDIVFVFSVTQIVGLLHDGFDWASVGQSILVFWLIWWAWSQFTWALNAADTTHKLVVLATLTATGVAFSLVITVPDAFGERAVWFAASYVAVRVIGLAIFAWVASSDRQHRAAVRKFALASVGGLVAVMIGGILGDAMQYWFWGAAILLDIIAAAIGGQAEGWDIHPEHFGERHALFVIIALGESLIVAAALVAGAPWTTELIAVAALAVGITFALWWSYFAYAKPELDRALNECSDEELPKMARDVFSLAHFPMLCGVIAFAAAIEEALAHPADPLAFEGRLALAIGLVLFVGGMAAATWRAKDRPLVPRTVVIAVPGRGGLFIVLVEGLAPAVTLAIAFVIVVLAVAVEHATAERRLKLTLGRSETEV